MRGFRCNLRGKYAHPGDVSTGPVKILFGYLVNDLADPQEFKDRQWDYSKFGRGERFVCKRIPKDEFEEVMDQVKRWGLDQHLKERRFEQLIAEIR